MAMQPGFGMYAPQQLGSQHALPGGGPRLQLPSLGGHAALGLPPTTLPQGGAFPQPLGSPLPAPMPYSAFLARANGGQFIGQQLGTPRGPCQLSAPVAAAAYGPYLGQPLQPLGQQPVQGMGGGVVKTADGQMRFQGGSLGRNGPTPTLSFGNQMGTLGNYAADVETMQENQICEQLGRTRFPSMAVAGPQAPSLPSGGALDGLLLEPGCARDLLARYPEVFRSEPPSEAGRKPHASGTFHGFNPGSYARKIFSPDAICRALRAADALWGGAPNVMRLMVPPRGRLVIVGDTHGQLEDVLWLFFKYGPPSAENQYLFNGDIVDRGGHALEILLLLLALKRDEPSCVHIIRGNHEDQTACTTFGFKAEIDSKFGLEGAGGWIFHLLTTQFFPLLPIGAVVSDVGGGFSAVVLHGGVPVRCPGLNGIVSIDNHINRVDRKQVTVQKQLNQRSVDDHILFNLLWADPAGPGENPAAGAGAGGRGNSYTEQETADFCSINRMRCVIRSHQVPKDGKGYEYHHNGRCITVFSASNYCGSQGNQGAVLLCAGDTYAQQGPRPSEHMAPAWPQLASVLAAVSFDAPQAERQLAASRAEANIHTPMGAVNSLSVQGPHQAPQWPQQQQQQKQQQQQQQQKLAPGLSALQQIEQFAAEQIVRHKRVLFVELASRDPQHHSIMPMAVWQACMAKILPEVPPVWQDLARQWELPAMVQYVEFLHRFQIVEQLSSSSSATHTDVFKAMGQLRIVISDIAAHDLLASADGDFNGSVSLEEFQGFLQAWKIQIPVWQAAAVYEGLVWSLKNQPNVEDILLAVALISRSGETGKNEVDANGINWQDVAKGVGETIMRASGGGSLVGFFRSCDVDRDGFLSPDELLAKLGDMLPRMGKQYTEEQLRTLVQHMDSQGVQNDRVSLIEFLRALGPRSLARELAGALLREVLKPIYFYRMMLEAYFQRFDPGSNNMVTVAQFQQGLQEMNRQLVADGGTELSEYQLQAVVEIASGNQPQVHYRAFLRALRVVDTVKRAGLVSLGQHSLWSFFASK
mmetsp:Transcript_162875/g.522218  ORF Transcript_162875/g.522218 Transcript_162875/m.522218 type:complete len:1036 (+) Transcript_162875:101-3208(+)